MTPGAVAERVAQLSAVREDPSVGRDEIAAALVAAREIEAWVQSQVAGLIGRLESIEAFPEATIAEAERCSLAEAHRATERADTLSSTPRLAAALADGTVTAGHVDAVTRASRQLEADERDELFERIETITDVAVRSSSDRFAQRVRLEARRVQRASADDRLERQRRNARVSTWIDDDGMWGLRGRFDPVTGLRLSSMIDRTVHALFAERTPAECPSDPVEKQRFLMARALERLIDGGGDGAGAGRHSGRADFVAVIDADAPIVSDAEGRASSPTVDWPIPVEVPGRILAQLACTGDVVGVVVRNGVVIHAPGELNLGRTTRLANRPQRRALRGLYRGCAVPGCTVRFDRCKLHHVVWWRHGGRTDLDNLLPVCSVHHTKIHNDGWIVELGPNRQLTLRLPDGTIRNTGPPDRRAA